MLPYRPRLHRMLRRVALPEQRKGTYQVTAKLKMAGQFDQTVVNVRFGKVDIRDPPVSSHCASLPAVFICVAAA
jgi:hypothetical protein